MLVFIVLFGLHMALGIELRALSVLDKCASTELAPNSLYHSFLIHCLSFRITYICRVTNFAKQLLKLNIIILDVMILECLATKKEGLVSKQKLIVLIFYTARNKTNSSETYKTKFI